MVNKIGVKVAKGKIVVIHIISVTKIFGSEKSGLKVIDLKIKDDEP